MIISGKYGKVLISKKPGRMNRSTMMEETFAPDRIHAEKGGSKK